MAKTRTLKPVKFLKKIFLGGRTLKKLIQQNLLRLVLENATSTCHEKPIAVEVFLFAHTHCPASNIIMRINLSF